MLTYTFDTHDTLTNQLYTYIKNDILHKRLKAHEKLPSKRKLANHLKISQITIENAYHLLLSEGYIYSKERVGYFVSQINIIVPSHKKSASFHLHKKKDYFLNFSSNQTDPHVFPFTNWSKMTRKVFNDYQEEILKPSPSSGCDILREAISSHLRNYRGIDVPIDQIIIGAGSEYLHHLLIQILGKNQIFGIETPGYPFLENLYASQNVPYQKIPVTSKGLNIQHIEDVSILHVTPSHHFPTGIITSIDKRYELIKWLQNHTYLIEDDYDSELRSDMKPIESIYSLDTQDKVIYMNTFSKTLASTIRISYMILPEKLMRIYQDNFSFYSCPVSTFEQYTLALFINEGYFEKHLNRLKTLYRKKRDYLFHCLNEAHLNYSIHEENAGLHFLIHLPMDISDEIFLENCERAHIHIEPLSKYGQNKIHTFVMNYSYLENSKILEGLKRLKKCTK